MFASDAASHEGINPRRRWSRGRVLVATALSAGVGLALLPVVAHPNQVQTTIRRACLAANGAQGDAESNSSAVSTDGHYVAFASLATNLVVGDTNAAGDVFLKDMQTGAILRASVATDGAQSNGESRSPAVSGSGSRTAFVSDATNLVPGDENALADVFVRDVSAGTTTRVSLPSSGGDPDGESYSAVISNDGRFVAFTSRATNLAAGDTNGESDVFVRDLLNGTLERVSVGPAGENANGASESPAISVDGRYIAFASTASNLLAVGTGSDTNGAWDIYVHDRTTGQNVRASVSTAGVQGDGHSFAPSISADGMVIAFSSYAMTLDPGDTNKQVDIFVRSIAAGSTMRVYGASGAQPNGDSFHPCISGDGYRVAFDSLATNWDGGTVAGKAGVVVFDATTGQVTCVSVSVGGSGASANGGAGGPAISLDGRWVAFSSGAWNLVSDDTNSTEDVFVRGPLP